jgi:hypothetical protein
MHKFETQTEKNERMNKKKMKIYELIKKNYFDSHEAIVELLSLFFEEKIHILFSK